MSQSVGQSELLDRLIADMRKRWQSGDKVLAESYIEQHPKLQSDDGLQSRLVLVEYRLRREFGDHPDQADYVRRFPQLANRLRELLQSEPVDAVTSAPGRGAASTVLASSSSDGQNTTVSVDQAAGQTDIGYGPPVDVVAPLGRFGGYELLAEIARGGMGIVYKARQVKANRTVALKTILAGQLASPEDVRRFETEASAAATLDHPNIVPIFEVGEQAGRHFYSMGFIDGQSLSDVLWDGPLAPNEAARIMLQVAQAVEYAHAQGIIHRDLKPQNILLSRDGSPRVADFGLAKRLSGTGELTATGQILGTPNFMSPEQARGDSHAIGPLSDVYSLGAVLYCLLTGRPPFQAANVIETLRQVVTQEPVSPRLLSDAVNRDLETITLKCLQKGPIKRYGSAAELADDLDRLLVGKPIQARPIARTERVWRWCRRNPLAASLWTAVSVLLLVGAIGGTTLAVIANRYAWRADQNAKRADRNAEFATEEAQKARLAQSAAEEQRRRAEQARDRTRQALDAMTSTETGDSLSTQKEISADQKKFLAEVLKYYQEFAGEKADDEASRARTAAAAYRVGSIESRLGRKEQAVVALRMARDRYATLMSGFPDVPKYRPELARSHNWLGVLLTDLGKRSEAEEEYRKALAILEKPATDFAAVPKHRQDLAHTHHNFGVLLAELGRRSQAESEYRKALAVDEKLVTDFPAMSAYREDLARTHNTLGILLRGLGKRSEAEQEYRNALTIQEKLVADFPTVLAHRLELANSHSSLGLLLAGLGKWSEAEEQHRKALGIQDKLAAEFPTVPEYRQRLAVSHSNLGNLLAGHKKQSEAQQEYRDALAIQDKLATDFTGVPTYRLELARTHFNLGILLGGLGKASGAEQEYRNALTIQDKLVADFPDVPAYRLELALSHNNLGLLLAGLGKQSEAEREYRKDLAIQEKLVADFPAVPGYRLELARIHYNLGNLLEGLDKRSDVEGEYRKAVAMLEKLTADFPTEPQYRRFLATSRTSLAMSRVNAGQVSEAIAEVTEWAKSWNGNAEEWYNFACVYAAAAGRSAQKRQEYGDRAMELLNKAVQTGFNDAGS